ncbi:hypothetical protein ABZ897_52315 [Nonomuraea sp. NPDC046802]|uniref:hypothetical protein n=1 Tax=Nonomuraea sp. NPDC046802 TaxID=3154919 RepID=UPI0033F4D6A7
MTDIIRVVLTIAIFVVFSLVVVDSRGSRSVGASDRHTAAAAVDRGDARRAGGDRAERFRLRRSRCCPFDENDTRPDPRP